MVCCLQCLTEHYFKTHVDVAVAVVVVVCELFLIALREIKMLAKQQHNFRLQGSIFCSRLNYSRKICFKDTWNCDLLVEKSDKTRWRILKTALNF